MSDGKVEAKDIYERLWQNRDFELTHLWQRSVFLATFLTLCFVGYGAIVLKMLDKELGLNRLLALNLMAAGICAIGTLLSLLWIFMAKGSKFWYEQQERRIATLVHGFKVLQEDIEGKEDNATGKLHELENLAAVDDVKKDDPSNCGRWFSPKAFRYSPSRINYAIGALFGVGFLLLGLVHICVAVAMSFKGMEWCRNLPSKCWVTGASLAYLLGTGFASWRLHLWCKSEHSK